jgi:cephalosporin hydroxylase
MQWEHDLTKDIRFHTADDDVDGVLEHLGFRWAYTVEFSSDNHRALQTAIDDCSPRPANFLEIGVHRNGEQSSTHTLIRNIPAGGIYLGVDLEDKSFLDDPARGVHTIQTSSSNYEIVVSRLKSLGVESLDFIFIDGWHSINQVLRDWEYTRLLTAGGVVAFHDTTGHPGPWFLINHLDTSKWHVHSNLCPQDHGLGYCKRRQ